MKQLLLVTALFFLEVSGMQAQPPGWLWARSGGGAFLDWSSSIATDLSGNIYAAGYYDDTSIVFGSTVLPNAGSSDIYLVKYNASGILSWARNAGGINADRATRICTDMTGAIWVTGYFRSPTINFGGVLLTNSDPTGATSELFIAKYNSSGSILWARSAPGGPGGSDGNGICADPFGNAYITGGFTDSILIFGSDTLRNVGGANPDIFVAKYDAAGSVLWARSYGDSLYEKGSDCGTDAHGNLYVAGTFGSPLLSLGSVVLSNVGNIDMFLVKFDSSGSIQWARSAGGIIDDYVMSMCTDAAGNSTLTGEYFSPSISFGVTSITNSDFSGQSDDFFVVNYDSLGNYRWSEGAGGSYLDGGSDICSDPYGNIYVTGYFEDSVITFGNKTLTHSGALGTDDLITVKYDSTGTALWAQSASGTEYEWGLSICTGIGGYVYVAGIYDDLACNFGSTTLGAVGSFDVFLAKLDYVTGISEISPGNQFEIFPNPSRGNITLRSKTVVGKADIYISDLLGQVVFEKSFFNTQNFLMDLDLIPGLYFVTLHDEQGNHKALKMLIE